MPSRTVTASSGGTLLAGISLLSGSLAARPVDFTGVAAGGAMTILGGVSLLAHLKGRSPMGVQQDIDSIVHRLKTAWADREKVVQVVEADLTELDRVVSEIESSIAKTSPPTNADTSTGTTSPTSTGTSAGSSPASNPSDFSSLA